MKKWQEKRQYKFRSDLLFYWATNLEVWLSTKLNFFLFSFFFFSNFFSFFVTLFSFFSLYVLFSFPCSLFHLYLLFLFSLTFINFQQDEEKLKIDREKGKSSSKYLITPMPQTEDEIIDMDTEDDVFFEGFFCLFVSLFLFFFFCLPFIRFFSLYSLFFLTLSLFFSFFFFLSWFTFQEKRF